MLISIIVQFGQLGGSLEFVKLSQLLRNFRVRIVI